MVAQYDGPPTPGWSIRARKLRYDYGYNAGDAYDARAKAYRERQQVRVIREMARQIKAL